MTNVSDWMLFQRLVLHSSQLSFFNGTMYELHDAQYETYMKLLETELRRRAIAFSRYLEYSVSLKHLETHVRFHAIQLKAELKPIHRN